MRVLIIDTRQHVHKYWQYKPDASEDREVGVVAGARHWLDTDTLQITMEFNDGSTISGTHLMNMDHHYVKRALRAAIDAGVDIGIDWEACAIYDGI